METIWTVACGNIVKAEDFGTYTNPTLDAFKLKLEKKGCKRSDDAKDFEIRFLCCEDSYDFWKGQSSVLLSELQNYEYPELAKMIGQAAGHNYPVHMCLERMDTSDRDNMTVFAMFVLSYQPTINRPVMAEWSMAWEVTGSLTTRVTYSEIFNLWHTLRGAKLLHF